MIEFDDMELLQLQFCMSQTKKMMAHPSEHMRHASITKKVEAEMNRRREENDTYTTKGILRQLSKQIERMEGEL